MQSAASCKPPSAWTSRTRNEDISTWQLHHTIPSQNQLRIAIRLGCIVSYPSWFFGNLEALQCQAISCRGCSVRLLVSCSSLPASLSHLPNHASLARFSEATLKNGAS